MEIVYDVTVKDFKILHQLVGWKPLDDEIIKKSLDNSMIKVSIFEKNKCIGMARVIGDFASHGLLADVIIAPDYQHQGYGTKLVNATTDKVQEFVNNGGDEFLLELCPTYGYEKFYQDCGLKLKPEKMSGMYKWYKNQNKYKEGAKKFSFKLDRYNFDLIKTGQKTVEMRLFDGKRQKIEIGDFIYFFNFDDLSQSVAVKVTGLYNFVDFKELYANFDKHALGYKDDETPSPDDMYKYYKDSDIVKYGTCAIRFELVK